MRIYIKSTRNGVEWYSSYFGMDEQTVIALVTELGGTNISVVTEEEYTQHTQGIL